MKLATFYNLKCCLLLTYLLSMHMIPVLLDSDIIAYVEIKTKQNVKTRSDNSPR
jgi:hypothetical protein